MLLLGWHGFVFMRIPVGIMFLRKFTFTSLSAAEVLKQPTTISYAPYSL